MIDMRVAIDCTPALFYTGGIHIYVRNLVGALSQIDKENDYLLFYNLWGHLRNRSLYINQSNFKLSKEYLPGLVKRFLMKNTPFSCSPMIGRVDIFHSTDFKGFKLTRGERWINTVHDLIVPLFPELVPKANLNRVMDYFKNYLPNADFIITISESSKRDIIKILKWPEDRIEVIYDAADISLQPGSEQEVKEVLGFDQPYILAVSTLEPRKNYPSLFRAFDLVRDAHKGPIKLVVVGQLGWLYDDIFTTHKKCRFGDDIVILTNIDTTQLGILYSGAEFFVHPSLYEGFGLPILEAQHMGKAVLAGNNSSIPELVSDSAILVDVKNEEEIVKGMLTLLENQDLRAKLIQKGYINIKRFSWEKTARETLAVYQKVFHKMGKK